MVQKLQLFWDYGGILPSGGVALGRVCACSLCSRIVFSLLIEYTNVESYQQKLEEGLLSKSYDFRYKLYVLPTKSSFISYISEQLYTFGAGSTVQGCIVNICMCIQSTVHTVQINSLQKKTYYTFGLPPISPPSSSVSRTSYFCTSPY